MFNLTCEILIGKYVFREAHQVSIHSGRNLLTATASIKLANVKTFAGNTSELDRSIAIGDAVTIKLGYDDENITEFVGFVAEKRQNVPFEFICYDGMADLKNKPMSKNYASISLKNLILELVPNAVIVGLPEVTLTNFRINNATVFQVLNRIKTTYPSIDLYFRAGVLYAGLPLQEPGLKTVVYDLQKTTIKNNLVFLNPTDVKVKVRAISQQMDGTNTIVEVGDENGDLTSAHFGAMTKDELTKQANEFLQKLKVKSYKGNVVAWGVPHCQHGDIAKWIDNYYPDRQQANFIDETTVEWGANGFRRTLVPGRKA